MEKEWKPKKAKDKKHFYLKEQRCLEQKSVKIKFS